MLKKMLTLLTALPLTLALCGQASAIGLSDAAKGRKPLCAEVAAIKNKADPRYVLNEFCDKITKSFHCTDGKRAGLFKYKGACDDPRICTNPVIQQACQEQCIDNRGIQDDKSRKISANLGKCRVQPATPPQRAPSFSSQMDPMTVAPQQAQRTPSMRQVAPPPMAPQQAQRAPSMSNGRPGSMVGQQPVMANPTYAPPPPPPPMPTNGYPKSRIAPVAPQPMMEEEVTNPEMATPPATYTEFEPVAKGPSSVIIPPAPPAPPPPPMNANRQVVRAPAQNPSIQAQARADAELAQGPNPRDGLLDQIRQGRELKKVEKQDTPKEPDLLAQIRQGTNLKKVEKPDTQKQQGPIPGSFEDQLSKKFQNVYGNDDDETQTDVNQNDPDNWD